MLARREYRPAYEVLQQLDKAYPDSVELQYLRMKLGTTLSDLSLIVQAGERLTQLHPDEADAHWNLAMAHLRMEHPALTVQELRLYLEYAPNGPSALAAERMIAELQTAAGDTWGPTGPYGEDGFAIVVDHERLHLILFYTSCSAKHLC
jgi:predicted Zn-dependent protease